jgi:hypothetical protein
MATERLFGAELLTEAGFPKLDSRGKEGCRHEIDLYHFQGFLKDGWGYLKMEDLVLARWLEKLIEIQTSDPQLEAVKRERISRSIRYGAALVYYPLLIQVEESGEEYGLPKASPEQENSLKVDLSEGEFEYLGDFLVEFDPELAGVLGECLNNPTAERDLNIDSEYAYLGAYFTYFCLASKAESNGLGDLFGESGD